MQTKRLISQIVFFIIFLVLMLTNKAQIWMAFIFLSIFLAAFFGRFYCGWICPIYTMIRPANLIGHKLGIQKRDIPSIFKSKIVRSIAFILFLIGLGYTIYTIRLGRKFPLPVIIITLGVITTIFVNQNTWHRYLCPWGTLLTFTGRFTKKSLNVNQEGCISCKKCFNICPAEAIHFDKKAAVMPRYCLICYKCHDICPVDVIHYKKNS